MDPNVAETEQTQEQVQEPPKTIDNLELSDINIGGEETQLTENVDDSTTTDKAGESSTEDTGAATTQANEDNESDPGGTGDEADSATNTTDEPAELSDEEIFQELSEETGVQITSYDEIKASLKELSSLQAQSQESNLSPAMQEAQKVEKAGGDLASHFQRVGMDFEKMDTTEALRQKFFKDNAALHKENPGLAQMKFERDFQGKYGKLEAYNKMSDEDKAEFAEENQAELDYERQSLEHDGSTAKKELITWKEEASKVEPQQPEGQMTEEEVVKYTEDYSNKVTQSFADFESVEIDLGEGFAKYNLGLNETTKPIVEGWLNQPEQFLKDIGFDGRDINTDKLLPIMTYLAEISSGTLGSRIAKHAMNSDNIDTLKQRLDKPTGSTKPGVASDRSSEGDIFDKVGEGFVKLKETETDENSDVGY